MSPVDLSRDPDRWKTEHVEEDEPPPVQAPPAEVPPPVEGEVLGARARALMAAAFYDTIRECVCGAPIPVVERPTAPLARTFLTSDPSCPKCVRIVAGLMPLGPFVREPEKKGAGVLDRFGLEFETSDEETLPVSVLQERCAALWSETSTDEEKRAAFEYLDAHHAFGRPFRRALNVRAHTRCFRCGGGLSAVSPGLGWPGDAADALMRAARGADEQPVTLEA